MTGDIADSLDHQTMRQLCEAYSEGFTHAQVQWLRQTPDGFDVYGNPTFHTAPPTKSTGEVIELAIISWI